VKPAKGEYREYLTYEFDDRQLDKATVALKWEELQVPIKLSVDNIAQLYAEQMRRELNGAGGLQWQNFLSAASYALAQKVEPKLALLWAQRAVGPVFPGQPNFQTLMTLAQAQLVNGLADDAKKTRDLALNSPTATAIDIHMYGRQLQQQGKKEEALAVFELNAKKHPNQWPVNVGLARAYSALGRYEEALKHAKLALEQAPDDGNRNALKAGIAKLEQGKDMNQ
jgi:tetratricopeptide (TPR) repeat protein